MANISFTGSHNSTFVVEDQGKILLVLETERFLGYKNSDASNNFYYVLII